MRYFDNEDAGDLSATHDADASAEGLRRIPHDEFTDYEGDDMREHPSQLVDRTLRAVTLDFIRIRNALEHEASENLGEISEETNALFANAAGTMQQKLEQCCVVHEQFEAVDDRFTREIERLTEQREVARNTKKRIKELMQFQMELAGIEKVETDHYKVWLQRNARRPVIINEDDVPDEYRTETVSVSMTPRDAAYLRDVLENMAEEGECKDAFDVATTTQIDKSAIAATYKAMMADGVDGDVPGTTYPEATRHLRIK